MAYTRTTDGAMNAADRTFTRDIVVTLLRVILGSLFIFVSIEKIADPAAFATSISAYRIVTGHSVLLIATLLPWIELLCGLGLLLGLLVRGSSLLALIMLSVFTIVVFSALWQGLDISCGCYTQDPAAERIGWSKVGENFLFILMSLAVYGRSELGFTLERLLLNRSLPETSPESSHPPFD
jgi:putative oxidoreductase